MPRTTDTRRRMLRTAAQLFRRQGYAATGWRQVVADSATPWGSQSHHFPGGKEQLAVEAIGRSAASYERLLRAAFDEATPGDARERFSGRGPSSAPRWRRKTCVIPAGAPPQPPRSRFPGSLIGVKRAI